MARGATHVGAKLEVGDTTLNVLLVGVVEVTVDDLLGEGKGAVKAGVSVNQIADNRDHGISS